MVINSSLSIAQIRNIHGDGGIDLWYQIQDELKPRPDYDKTKFFVVFADSVDENGKLLMGSAWGGGNVGMFHSGNLYAWAEGIKDFIPKLTDEKKIDAFNLPNDSRDGTFRGNFATGAGALLHEATHTFGGSHDVSEGCAVMKRGFDFYETMFVSGKELRVCLDDGTVAKFNNDAWLK